MQRRDKLKKTLVAGLAIGAMMLGMADMASAGVIVDTGPGPSQPGWTLSSGNSNMTDQWLAAEFMLNNDSYITDMFGWIYNNNQTGNMFTISVYGDGGEVPDTSNLIYSNAATIAGAANQANWEGYHISWGNGLQLTQGTYWISFEVRPNNYNNPYSGSMPNPSLSPLVNEAFTTGTWTGNDDLNIGVKILGNTISPVPEPATMLLMGTGLAGIIGARRKKKG